MIEHLIDKYKPKSLDEMILNPATRIELEKLSRNNLSFILEGPPGCGKGTFVDILLSRENVDYLWVDAAKADADYIRNDIKRYCVSVLNYKGENFVIFNEADKIHIESQILLKEIIEQYAAEKRFVFMTNKIKKIDEAILSRLKTVEFRNPVRGDVIKWLEYLLVNEGSDLNHGTMKITNKCLSSGYTDFRKIMNELQNFIYN